LVIGENISKLQIQNLNFFRCVVADRRVATPVGAQAARKRFNQWRKVKLLIIFTRTR
jgi:hypothetical protein